MENGSEGQEWKPVTSEEATAAPAEPWWWPGQGCGEKRPALSYIFWGVGEPFGEGLTSRAGGGSRVGELCGVQVASQVLAEAEKMPFSLSQLALEPQMGPAAGPM